MRFYSAHNAVTFLFKNIWQVLHRILYINYLIHSLTFRVCNAKFAIPPDDCHRNFALMLYSTLLLFFTISLHLLIPCPLQSTYSISSLCPYLSYLLYLSRTVRFLQMTAPTNSAASNLQILPVIVIVFTYP